MAALTTTKIIRGAAACAAVAACAWPATAAGQTAAGGPTFSRDVAPILQRACQQCHRPGEAAPMSLLGYGDARPWARAIKQRVLTREMPPWQIDRTLDTRAYVDDLSLTAAEIDTIVRWVDGGAPAGDPSDLPPPRTFPAGYDWVIGEPDHIVHIDEYRVPAEATDQFFDVWLAPDRIGLDGDRYVRAMQLMPGSREVLHHSTVYKVDADDAAAGGTVPFERRQLFLNWAAGKEVERYPDDTGKLLQRDASLLFAMHYHAIGEEVLDRSRLGLVLHPKGVVPAHRPYTVIIGAAENREPLRLDFPAGAESVRTDFYHELDAPTRVLDFQAHMHYRGKAMSLAAILPDGRRELLTAISRYNWAWQFAYAYEDPPVLPAGTRLHVTGYHDNSAGNRHNPAPENWVGYGQRTIDEMSMGVTNLVTLGEDEYQRHLALRRGSDQQ